MSGEGCTVHLQVTILAAWKEIMKLKVKESLVSLLKQTLAVVGREKSLARVYCVERRQLRRFHSNSWARYSASQKSLNETREVLLYLEVSRVSPHFINTAYKLLTAHKICACCH